ncbi:DUF4870 domain-containing protein [uncultured Algibacter sp.]|uniref:DUF4870 domain-containing protein n=1 Tax=uncultured Algibacter sp. TaxID=298659 RepID=UPI0032177788
MLNNHQKNIATFIHLSTFSRFFIPFGNLIGPIALWLINKDKSDFVDRHGKQAINFQISILLYVLIIGVLTIPFFLFSFFTGIDIFHISGALDFQFSFKRLSPVFFIAGGFGAFVVFSFLLELALVVRASLKARDGELYNYPFTIKFLK